MCFVFSDLVDIFDFYLLSNYLPYFQYKALGALFNLKPLTLTDHEIDYLLKSIDWGNLTYFNKRLIDKLIGGLYEKNSIYLDYYIVLYNYFIAY